MKTYSDDSQVDVSKGTHQSNRLADQMLINITQLAVADRKHQCGIQVFPLISDHYKVLVLVVCVIHVTVGAVH